MGKLAILACGGALPVLLAKAHPNALHYTLTGVPSALSASAQDFALEQIGSLFEAMKTAGVTHMVFAGTLTRPALDPVRFDAAMMRIAPRLMQAIPQGDDALLRTVIAIFEDEGFTVQGAHELLPALVADVALSVGPDPTAAERSDIARAADIMRALAPLDVGQGCVVAGGQCLGIETVQGTDALLEFVARTPQQLRRGASLRGVFVKAPKIGQDLRVDMPAIGPATVEAAARAGLGGIMLEAGGVLVLERARVVSAAEAHGIFLRAGPLG